MRSREKLISDMIGGDEWNYDDSNLEEMYSIAAAHISGLIFLG